MKSLSLWLRWSWRDIRARWIQVAAIALVIALGTGTYAGLGSTSEWRLLSADASYGVLHYHDIRVELTEGSFVPRGTLAGVLEDLPDGTVAAQEERLIVPTLVETAAPDQEVLVTGRLIGMDLAEEPAVDLLDRVSGRALAADDAGRGTVVLERNFAGYYDLPSSGTITVSGGAELQYVGHASAPEYFIVTTDDGGVFQQANLAVVFGPLETVQEATGLGAVVNDLVLTLSPGNDAAAVADAVEAAFDTALPEVGTIVVPRGDDPTYSMIYEDIENDAQNFRVFAVMIFIGAIAAAFNLTNRLVEAQRREIGIAMALGVRGRRIAVRPLLVGAQIALLGVIFGVGVGLLLAAGMRGFLQDFFPLPIWDTSFQARVFIGAAVIGVVAPFAATIIPVWRAVRVPPIEAIQKAHLARRTRRGWWRSRASVGNTFRRMPMRNLLRAPRRTILTALGIAAAISVAFALLGMIDSFTRTVDVGEEEILGEHPDRIISALNWVYPEDDPVVTAITGAPEIGAIDVDLTVPATLEDGGADIEIALQVIDLDGGLWAPTVPGGMMATDGVDVLLAPKAAEDLGVGTGDTITLRHPRPTGPTSFRFDRTEAVVAGIHQLPYRFAVYVDESDAAALGLDGLANTFSLIPAAGQTLNDVKRALFQIDAVASVIQANQAAETIEDLIAQFVGILQVVEGAVFLLALVIAFNAASLNLDERARDHATMFAYGVKVRTALRMAVVEAGLLGTLATAMGLALGFGIVRWFVFSVAAETMPEMGMILSISPQTILVVLILGIGAVAVAPVFTLRKMRRMDLPGTLRVME